MNRTFRLFVTVVEEKILYRETILTVARKVVVSHETSYV